MKLNLKNWKPTLRGTLGFVLVASFTTGCTTSKLAESGVEAAFPGYKALEPPRANLEIGAILLGDSATTGNGLGAEDLMVQAIPAMELRSGELSQLGAIIPGIVELDANTKSALEIQIKSGSIVSVKDISKLPVNEGSKFLYQAVRVDEITLKVRGGYSIEALDAAIKELGVVGAHAKKISDSQASIEGANLYIAYRTIEFSRPKVSRKSIDVHYDSKSSTTVSGFNLTAWTNFRYDCREEPAVNWRVRNESIRVAGSSLSLDGIFTLAKRTSDKYDAPPGMRIYDVSADKYAPVYRGVSGSKVVEAQVRTKYDGKEFARGPECKLVVDGSGKGTAEISVVEYAFDFR